MDGSGKGIHAVRCREDFVAVREGAKRNTRAAFGDDARLLEMLSVKLRHVESQVLAGLHSNVVCLGKRECSI